MIEPDINERMARFAPSQNLFDPAQMNEEQLKYLDSLKAASDTDLKSTMMAARKVNPDQAARAQALGSQVGVGADIAVRNMDEVEQRAYMQRLAQLNLSQNDPVLARFLSSKSNAMVAHDDLDTLRETKGLFGDAVAGFRSGEVQTAQSYEVYDLMMSRVQPGSYEWNQAKKRAELSERMMDETGKGFVASGAQIVGAEWEPFIEAQRVGAAASAAGVSYALATESVPAPVAAGFAYTAGVVGSLATSSYKRMAGNIYFQMREEGIEEDSARTIAHIAGAVNASIEFVGMIPVVGQAKSAVMRMITGEVVEQLTKQGLLKVATTAVKESGTTIGVNILEENAQEFVDAAAMSAGQYFSGKQVDLFTADGWRKQMQAHVETTIQTFKAMTLLSLPLPTLNAGLRMRGLNKSKQDVARLEKAMNLMAQSRLRKRDPAAAQALIDARTEGVPGTKLYIEAAEVADVLKQANVDPRALDGLVPGFSRRLGEALASNGDLVMTQGEFLAQLADQDVGRAMLKHVRVGDPEAKSAVQIKQIEQEALRMVEDLRKSAGQFATQTKEYVEQVNAIEDDIIAMAELTGRFTPEQIRTNAALQLSFVVTQAKELKMEPRVFWALFRNQIIGPDAVRVEQEQQAQAVAQQQVATLSAEHMAAVERGDMEAAQRMVDEAEQAWIASTELSGNQIMPTTGTTPGDIRLPLYRFVDGTELRDPQRDIHWTHSRQEIEKMASESEGFIVVAKHPGLDRVLDWESASDRPLMEATIGGYEYRGSVFPEVPIRPGRMEIVSITKVDADGNRTIIQSADPVTRDEQGNVIPLSRRFDITSPRLFEQQPVTPPPDAGIFDVNNPPAPTDARYESEGGGPVVALMDYDGNVYYDRNARMHGDLLDTFPELEADMIIDGGFISDGKYVPNRSDGGFAAGEAGPEMVQRVRELTKRVNTPRPTTLQQTMSTRVPSAKGMELAALEDMLVADLDTMLQSERMVDGNLSLIESLGIPVDIDKSLPKEEQLRQAIRWMADNLLALHDKMNAEQRARAKLWYVGGRRIVDSMAQRYGITDMQAAAMLAVLSPQKNWFENVSMAFRIGDILTSQRDSTWTPEIDQRFRRDVDDAMAAVPIAEARLEQAQSERPRRAVRRKDESDEKFAERMAKWERNKKRLLAKYEADVAQWQNDIDALDERIGEAAEAGESTAALRFERAVLNREKPRKPRAPKQTVAETSEQFAERKAQQEKAIDEHDKRIEKLRKVVESKKKAAARMEAIDQSADIAGLRAGMTLGQLLDTGNFDIAARFVRYYDEAYNGREFAIITPEGGMAGPSQGRDGPLTMRWGSFSTIAKAISVYEDGRAENVHMQIGMAHKVRNFYNNLFDPTNPNAGTIDTHAIAAAVLQALGASSDIVSWGLGSGVSDARLGLRGGYPIVFEAYRLAAQERGLLVREMQSITWEAVRGLFEAAMKKSLAEPVSAIWARYKAKEITIEQAREEIFTLAKGIKTPEWVTQPTDLPVSATYAGQSETAMAAMPQAQQRPLQESQVFVEVAPDPTDVATTARWNALTNQQRHDISVSVMRDVFPMIMREFGVSGTYTLQLGGFEGSTNYSFALNIPNGPLVRQISAAIGYVLSQKETMAVSHQPFQGSEQRGVVFIDIAPGLTQDKIHDLYVNVLKPIGVEGFTLRNGTEMVVTTKDAVAANALNNAILALAALEPRIAAVQFGDAHVREDKPNETYARAGRGATGRRRLDNWRAAATRRIADELDNLGKLKQEAVPPRGAGYQVEPAADRGLAPLRGAPSERGISGPDPAIVDVAREYAAANGIPFGRQSEYATVDVARARRIADAYAQMKDDPGNPAVREAYLELARQTRAQYDALVAAGYQFYFFDPDNDPYAGQPGGFGNPWNAINDLRQNKRMAVYPTDAGFGTGLTTSDYDVSRNPLLADAGISWPYGSPDGPMRPVRINDLFRAVHDTFGHSLEGAGFRARGEENAWQAHVRLFYGPAVGAMTSETRGQNSWLNYGPHGAMNRTASVEETVFADQKIGLMPEWTWAEGRVAEQPYPERTTLRQEAPEPADVQGTFDVNKFITTVNASANISTLAHEGAHWWLEVMGRLAARPDASERTKSDFDKILQWFGIEGATAEERLARWNSMSLAEKEQHHEAFARNWEILLYEGKAPSAELQSVFEKFSLWMKQLYISIRDQFNAQHKAKFGVDLPMMSQEIREVMERVIASDEQIARQKAIRSAMGLFETKPDDMTDAEWEAYQQMQQEADAESVAELRAQSLKAMKWLRRAERGVLRDMQEETNQRRSEMREKVAEEVPLQRVYRAREFLSRGRFVDATGTEEVAEGHRLDIDAVRQMYELEPENLRPDLSKLGTGGYGMMGKGGMNPEVAAEMFGYASADEMIRDLIQAPPVDEAIEAETDRRMLAEYGDMNTKEQREAAVDSALHNELRSRMNAVELRFLSKATQPVRVMVDAARRVARNIIGQRRLRDIRPREYIAAESRAARDAQEAYRNLPNPETVGKAAYTRSMNEQASAIAAGMAVSDAEAIAQQAQQEATQQAKERIAEYRKKYPSDDPTAIAIAAKRQQLLNHELAREALAARDEVDKAIGKFRRMFKADADIAKTRNMDKVMAARAILAAFGLGRSDKPVSAYMEQIRKYDPDMAAELEPIIAAATAGAVDYRDMTLDQFRAMRDAVEALWFNAKRDQEIVIEGQSVRLEAALGELSARLEEMGVPEVVPGERMAPTAAQVAAREIVGLKAHMRTTESWAEAMDAQRPGGPFTKYIWNPVKAAINAYRIDRNKYVKRLVEIISGIDLPVQKIHSNELGYTFGQGNGGIGKAEVLGAMMHMGNESNLRKLLLGRRWGELDADGNLDTSRWDAFVQRMFAEGIITKADMDALQQIWDLNEELKPLAQKAHRQIFGYYFKEVEASPVQTPFGTYRGGYVPAKTDRFMVQEARQQAMMEDLETDFRQSMPSTGFGFTKGRVEYNRPLSLDMRLMASHIDGVLRFAHIQPAIKDVLKLLKNRAFAEILTRVDPTVIEDMLIPWLNRAARQVTSEAGRHPRLDKFWRGVRSRTGIAIMMGNLSNIMQQVTGLMVARVKVKGRYMRGALMDYMKSPFATADMVANMSPFMMERMRGQVFQLQSDLNDLLLNPSRYAKIKDWVAKHGYFGQQAAQNVVDIVAWVGAYNQTIAEVGGTMTREKAHAEAVNRADAVVRLTQSSLLPEDMSRYQVGTPFYQTFVQFTSYFNMLANLNLTEYTVIFRDLGWKGNKGRLFATYLFGFAMPMIVADAIAKTMRGQWDDEDEDGYLDEFMDVFFGSQLRGMTAMIPFGSAAYTALAGGFTDKTYDDRITSSPSVAALEASTVGLGRTMVAAVDPDKDISGRNVRDTLTLVSLVTGLPLQPLARPFLYAMEVERGNIEPTDMADYIRGLITGTASEGTRR